MGSLIKYVYICSAGHSGSTLLDLLLGSHSRVESLGEISQLSKNISLNTTCTCGSPIRKCPVWDKIIEKISVDVRKDIKADPYAFHMGYPKASVVIDKAHQTLSYLLWRKIVLGIHYFRLRYGFRIVDIFLNGVKKSINNTFLLYDTVRSILDTDIVVDSSKSYLSAVSLYLERPENFRIILLTRDGRGVFWSNIKRDYPRRRSVISWRNQYQRALPLLEKYVKPEDILFVKYENLVTKTESELIRICEFLHIEYESMMLNFTGHIHHSTNGNDMRMSSNSEINIDNSWRSKLSAHDLDYFNHYAGRLNQRLGYE